MIGDGGNEPAFPVLELNKVTGDVCAQHFGVTIRDYFAAKAMDAMINGSWPDSTDRAEIAKRAYLMADDMLKARSA